MFVTLLRVAAWLVLATGALFALLALLVATPEARWVSAGIWAGGGLLFFMVLMAFSNPDKQGEGEEH